MVGGTTDIAVGKLTNGLGGDSVDLSVGELERAVPRPVAGSLPAQVKDSSALTSSAAMSRGCARKTSKSFGHWSRDEATTVKHLHGGNMPRSNGHLVHGLNFLLSAELLRVVNDVIIATSNIGAESLLGGLGNDAELVLAEKLVAVRLLKGNALSLDSLKSSKLVDKHILALDADDIVLECPIV